MDRNEWPNQGPVRHDGSGLTLNPPQPTPPLLDEANARLFDLAKRATFMADRAQGIADNTFGCQPSAASVDPANTPSVSRASELLHLIGELSTALTTIDRELDRLARV